MRALILPLLLIAAAIPTALGALYLLIPFIGPERADRAANMVCMVGGLGLMVSGGWAAWKLLDRLLGR